MPWIKRQDDKAWCNRASQYAGEDRQCLNRFAAAGGEVGGTHGQQGGNDVGGGAGIAQDDHLTQVAAVKQGLPRSP